MRVELRRGGLVESVHRVHAAVVRPDGALEAHAGDPALVSFWRSAAKPFQAMPLVVDGAAERLGLTEEDLALCCASHSSEPGQVERVRAFLARIGCRESDLRCGPHPPLSDDVARAYERQGLTLTPVYSNCSGKHTGMLALARHHGWPTDGYQALDHPVQQRCLREVSRWTDVPEDRIGTAVDGCGVVCFALPLRNMAAAYARLPNAERGTRNAEFGLEGGAQENGPSALKGFRTPHSAFRIVQAMLAHPDLIAGQGRPCTEMMRAHAGRVITKVGAEGVYSALLLEEGLGVTLKIEDGHGPAAALAMASVLEQLGLRPQPESLARRAVQNTRGEPVGELRVFGALER